MFILAGNAILLIFIVYSGVSNFSNNERDFATENLTQVTQVNPTKTPVTNTFTPSPTPTLTPEPTITPTPTKELTTPTPEEKNESNIPNNTMGNTGLSLISQINNFRTGKGLAPLSTDGYTCGFATLRAREIASTFNHDGFSSRIDGNSLPYPSYSNVAENIAMNSDPNGVVPGWINSPGHRENMSKDVPYGCVGVSGNYYVFEAWRP